MLTTARLLLRPSRPSDAASFFAFLGDPAAMRFTHCHASVRECRRRLAGSARHATTLNRPASEVSNWSPVPAHYGIYRTPELEKRRRELPGE